MGGDGTGLPLGVNDPVLAFVLVAMATLIWALYFFAGGADEGIINGAEAPALLCPAVAALSVVCMANSRRRALHARAGGKDDDSGLSL